jgi:hypothetical protein
MSAVPQLSEGAKYTWHQITGDKKKLKKVEKVTLSPILAKKPLTGPDGCYEEFTAHDVKEAYFDLYAMEIEERIGGTMNPWERHVAWNEFIAADLYFEEFLENEAAEMNDYLKEQYDLALSDLAPYFDTSLVEGYFHIKSFDNSTVASVYAAISRTSRPKE